MSERQHLTGAGPSAHGHSEPLSVAQVLQQMPGPAGPLLHLSPAFASRDSQERLQRFIQQFICS